MSHELPSFHHAPDFFSRACTTCRCPLLINPDPIGNPAANARRSPTAPTAPGDSLSVQNDLRVAALCQTSRPLTTAFDHTLMLPELIFDRGCGILLGD